MTCKQCGGIMTVDKKNEMFVCPFCGTVEPFDSLSKEELQQMLDDALSDVREQNRELKQTIKNTETAVSLKYTVTIVIMVIAALFFAIFTMYGFDTGKYLVGTISAIQLVLIILAIIFMANAKAKKNPKFSTAASILIGLAGSMVIVWFVAVGMTEGSSDSKRKNEPETWPTIGMGSDLPEPDSFIKEAYNTDNYFHARITDTDKSGFEDYVSDCKAAGYNLDSYLKDYKFVAYNKNGDELELSFYYDSEINVTVHKALEYTEFYWPKSGGLQDVPAPEADKINVESLSDSSVRLTVATVTKDYFMQYIEELKEAGFSGSYDDNERQYYGEKGKVHVRITIKRNSILYFDVYNLK